MKKEQVKGCGSVNRPTPGSQRPAEPVATGFSQGVKFPIFRGQISGLGVKLWVVDAGFSWPRAVPHGVRVWVVAVSCCEQGKQSAWLSSLAQNAGLSPGPSGKAISLSSALKKVPHRKIWVAISKEKDSENSPPKVGVKPPKGRKFFLHMVQNIRLDIGNTYRVVLAVDKTTRGEELPC